MTLTHSRERIPAAERIAVRCVDSDVHPTPKRGEIIPYIPEPWRSKYFLSRNVGEQIYYDAPDYAHAYAMRTDSFPPNGEFPGSDPDMAFRQLIMEAGSDIGILEPAAYPARIPEAQLRNRGGRQIRLAVAFTLRYPDQHDPIAGARDHRLGYSPAGDPLNGLVRDIRKGDGDDRLTREHPV